MAVVVLVYTFIW